MRVNERMKKVFSILLCLCMVLQYVPTTAFAVTTAESGLCGHHAEHTAECGYAEAVAGSDCTHSHDELCGYIEAVAEVKCACEATDENGALVHTEGCGYVAPVTGSDCAHVHDDSCGYAEAVEAHECTFACEECKAEEAHTHVYDREAQYAQKDDAVHTVTRACTSCEEQPTQTVEEAHAYAEGFCVCGKAEPVHTHVYVEGICECGAACEHIYAEGVCTVCSMAEPVQEPQVLTITAWSWVDDYEIIDPDYMDAVIPGVGAENPIDWETLVEFLPSYITAQVNGEEVEIPVTWECETFPEAATGGKYTVKAILPAGYVLGEGVTALEVDVDLGTVQQYAITPTQPTNGDGSESSPYQITTAGELYWFAAYVNAGNASACAKLMNDITVNENVLVNGTLNSDTSNLVAWTPIGVRIGSSTKAFRGTFDGGNHTISGLYVSAASGYQGLFGFMESGTVKNVTVANSYFSGTTNIGAVVGCYGTEGVSTVTNCHNVGSVVIGSDYYVGGVVGGQYAPATYHAQIVVSGCSNSGSVTGAKHYVGGIIGYAEYFSEGTAISNCTNTGTVTNTSTSRAQGTGGIAGYFGGSSSVTVKIVGCTNSGTIQITEGGKQDYMGGIIGQNSYGHISDCNNAGTISGYQYAGGIVGTNRGTVTNCQNTGAVISTYAGIGGIVGKNNGTVTGCTNSADVQGQWYVGGIIGSGIGTGLSDCTNTGDVTSNTYGAGGVIGYVDAAGTVENCHNEGDVKGTYYIGGLVGHHYTGKVTYTECSNKGAVGGSSQNVGGLFGRIAAGSTVKECYNTGGVTCTGTYSKKDNYGVGGLAGTTYNAVIFEDCYNTGSVNGGSNPYVGGLVGFFHYASGSTENYIKRSHNTGSVVGGICVGGLFGTYESNGVSEECYNTGSVNGNNNVGGLVGYHQSTGSGVGVIKNCYNTGSVSGTSYVGGLFGYSYYNNCLETSYNVGTVSGTSSIGGAIGNSSNNKSVVNCYYLDACVTNGKTVTGATALTAQQMTDDANWQTNFAGFDATNVWSKDTNAANMVYFPKLDSYSPALHVHSWTYTASDANSDGVNDTITAGCNAAGCTESNGGSVTIAAPDELVYSGSSMDAVCTYTDWLPDKVDVSYNDIDRVNVTGQNIEASLTYGDVTVSVSYQIAPRVLTDSMVTISNVTYNGNEKTAKVTVKYNSSTTLTAGTHYDVTGTTAATEIGTYTVTVTGKGNYTGTVEKTWTISKGSLSSEIKIESWTYLGDPQEPSVTNNPENGEVTYTYYISSDRRPTMTGTDHGAETAGGVPKYAGTYYVGAIIAETERYKQTTIRPSADTAFVISPREVTEPIFEGLQATYPYDNGNEIKPIFTLKDDLGNIIPESEYTVSYTDNTGAGTATITVTDNENGNYTVSGTATFDISTHEHEWKYTAEGSTITATCTGTIGTCPIATVTITAENTTYNGTAQETATVAYSEGWNSGKLTVSYVNNVSAGTATASITIGEATASVEFTIAKAEIDGLTLIGPEFAEGLVYNGTAQALVTQTGSVNGGTIVYSLSRYGEYTETIPVATETGTYVVYWMIKGDENHNDGGNPGDAYTTVYIAKANPEYTIPTGLTATYGDTLANVELPTGWAWKDAETTFVGNAGTRTFKAVFTPANTVNYNTVEADVTVEVAKANPEYTVPTGLTATYGDTLANVELPTGWAWKDAETTSVGNAGTRTFKAVFTPADTVNYNTVEADVTIEVAKAEIDGSTLINPEFAEGLIYNGTAQALVTKIGSVDGGYIVYSLSIDGEYTTTIPVATEAGTYRVYWTIECDENHYVDGTPGSSRVTIAAKDASNATVTLDDTSVQFDGTAKTPGVTSVIVDGKTLNAETDYEVSYRDNTYVGTATVTITFKGNYTGNAISATFTIVRAAAPAIQWPTAGSLTYGQKLSESTLTSEDANGTFAWENGEQIPTVTNSGYVVVYTPKDTVNYDYSGVTLTQTIPVTVSKAPASVETAPAANTLIYTGEAQALVTAGAANNGEMQYSTDNQTWRTAIPKGTNAGEYTVYYKVVGDANHIDTDVQSVVVKIGQLAVAEPTVSGTYTYTGKEQMVTLTGVESYMTVVSGNKAVGAGSYEAVITLDGNHKWADGSDGKVQWSIGKAEFGDVYVSQSGMLTYNGTAQTPNVNTDADSVGNQTATFAYRLTENESYGEMPAFTDAGTYTVYYKASAPNHKDATGSFTVMVDKAKAEITVDTDPITVTYGDTVELPDATANFGTVSCDKTAAELVNVGTYTVTYTVEGTDNYEGDTKTVTVTIEKLAVAEPTVTGTYTYTGEEQTAQLTGVESCMTVASGDKATNAGSYEAEITLDGNHQWAEGSDGKVQWSIGKAQAEIAVNTDPITAVYGGTVKLPEATANFGTVTCDTTADKLVNAGTYTVTYTVASTANFDGDSKTVTVTVNPKAITEADVSLNGSLVYTGSELTQAVTVTAGVTYEVTGNKATDVGTYELTVKATGNYTGEVKLNWSIKETAAVVTKAPAAKTLTYTGTAQNLVNAGSANGGTMVYSLSENGQYTETIPTGANAGEYTVWYYVQGDANHSDTAKASIKVMIHRASATFEITNNVVLEGTEIKLTVTSEPANVSHEVSYRQDGKSVAVPAAVGEYDVYITITDSNYRHATSTDGSALKVGVLSIYKEETPETYTLSYAAGGATGTMSAEQAALAGTVRILPESTFTAPKDENDNAMLFAGWNDGTAVYQPGEKYVQPEQNVTMTAVWQVEKHNISGMVKQYVSLDSTERVNREGVTITLMLGSRQITQTVTDENGNYQFEHCLQGTYNLIAEYEGIKQTIKVVLGHSDQTGQEIDLPAAKTNTAVAVQPGTPAVVVGGMDDMMTKTDDTVFTEEDKDTVEAGGEVEIKMDIKENPAPANKAEIDQKVEDSLNTSATVELYIDLDLTKTVRDANGTEQSSTAITESNVLLENIIFLPGHLQGKDAYHVFRQHGNDVEEMKELPAGTEVKEEGFVVDRTNHTITIYSRKYSTFAIVTSEVFTITFDANGGTVGTSTMETEEKLNTLPTPERSGFKFIGWFTEKTGGTEVDTSTVFTQDTTVYAQWERIGYQIEFPTTDTTGTIKAGGVVEIDGKLVTIDNNGEIWMPATGSKLLVSYKFNENADPHKEYPTAMYAWFLKWEGDTCEAIRIPELDNFMTYKGTSIRVGHSSDGIRFFTAVPVDALNKVMAGTLLTGELEGYKLVEMGTLYKWAATGTELTIENGAKSYVYGGSAGSTYRQFSKEGDLSWFTGMLTDLPGDAQTLAKDILSRPYAVFQKGNDTIVLYGGSIQRSIYYVALQNKDTWATGTAYDNYVEKIISTVDAANG